MKRLVVLIAITFVFVTANSQQKNGAIITWEKSTYDFGEIIQGDKVEHTFKFTNTGDQDLVITNVEVTCGCTTPKGWPRDPIPPGGNGEITVAFNSIGKKGLQNKVVTITSNAIGKTNQVTFTATVLENNAN